jgi:hypothetical protein
MWLTFMQWSLVAAYAAVAMHSANLAFVTATIPWNTNEVRDISTQKSPEEPPVPPSCP